MSWSSAQRARLASERTILFRYFPTMQWNFPTKARRTYVEGPIFTNSRRGYWLRVYVPERFPSVCPDMVVSQPSPLRNARGRALTAVDRAMHVLGSRDGHTMICHYDPSRWVPQNTLYLVVLKGRVWLEAYESHLRTGKPIDHVLSHM